MFNMIWNQKFRILTALCMLSTAAYAADQTEKWDEKFYNPKADKDDLIMPMPCNGSMAFRIVKTGTKSPLDDMAIVLGSDNGTDAFAEHSTPNYISGGFSGKSDGKDQERYFLMAKYEVSQLQYQAVMDGQCPSPNMKGRLPAVDVSWFDAVDFSHKYNEWLMKNSRDKLPQEDGVSGFIRLPTNTEWEYAARGGIAVSASEFRENTFPVPNGLKAYAWFSGSQSANGRLQLGGLLEPNPLGLFDMLGNASEIMLEPFKLNKLDRYHGQNGGVTVRGGSYLTPEGEISSALRIERPFYAADGTADKAKDMGFRVVIAAPVLTSGNRIKEIDSEWKNLGNDNLKNDSHGSGGNIVGKLEQITNDIDNENVKKELKSLQDALRAANQSRDEQRDHAIRSALELGAFLCTNISDLEANYQQKIAAQNYITQACPAGSDPVGLCEPTAIEERKTVLAEAKGVRDFVLTYYADTIVSTSTAYNIATVQAQVDKKQLAGKANLANYVDLYWKHLQQYYKDGKVNREQWLNDCKQNNQ